MNTTERNARIMENMGLVHRVANMFTNSGIPFEDLAQEGVFGLAKAIEGYDPSRGTTLATYAEYKIRHEIRRYVQNHATQIRVPVHAQAEVSAPDMVSMNAPLRDAESGELGDTLGEQDESYADVEDRITTNALLSVLDPRSREIVRARYLDGEQLPEIGQRLGVSKQRVAQICNAALDRMREQVA